MVATNTYRYSTPERGSTIQITEFLCLINLNQTDVANTMQLSNTGLENMLCFRYLNYDYLNNDRTSGQIKPGLFHEDG